MSISKNIINFLKKKKKFNIDIQLNHIEDYKNLFNQDNTNRITVLNFSHFFFKKNIIFFEKFMKILAKEFSKSFSNLINKKVEVKYYKFDIKFLKIFNDDLLNNILFENFSFYFLDGLFFFNFPRFLIDSIIFYIFRGKKSYKNKCSNKFLDKFTFGEASIFEFFFKKNYLFLKNFFLEYFDVSITKFKDFYMNQKIENNHIFSKKYIIFHFIFYLSSQKFTFYFYVPESFFKSLNFLKKNNIYFLEKNTIKCFNNIHIQKIFNINIFLNIHSENFLLCLNSVLSWRVGDIFKLYNFQNVIILLNNFPVFFAKYGIYDKKFSICITKIFNKNLYNLFLKENNNMKEDKKNFTQNIDVNLNKNRSDFSTINNFKEHNNEKITKSKNDMMKENNNNSKNFLENYTVLSHIPVSISVELGKINITIKKLLKLSVGDILYLETGSGDSLNILVNNCCIARGELVIVNKKYGIRITKIIS